MNDDERVNKKNNIMHSSHMHPKKSFACWVIFHVFLSSADFFSKLTFSKNSFGNNIRVSNSLDQDQAQNFVNPDLWYKLLARVISRRHW